MKQYRLKSKKQYYGPVWALIGFTVLIGTALVRLVPHGYEAAMSGLNFWQISILVIWSIFMLYTEGYKAFWQQLAPRFASRATHLLYSKCVACNVFAPLFCVGFIDSTVRRKFISWTTTIGIVILIVVVRQFPQPWRGIIDIGVILGLAYGLVAVYYYFIDAFRRRYTPVQPELAPQH